jgi:hypothetical protein
VTPDRVKEASRKKRERTCVICGAQFLVKKSSHKGATCSKPCLSEYWRRAKTGLEQSKATKAKRSQALKAFRADPDRNAKWTEAAAAGAAKWHSAPDNAEAFAKRSSDRMKRRHADPDWQKVRDERSSRTMKANWERHRDSFVASSVERYARGEGFNSEEAKQKKAEANKWIMTKAQEALHSETDIDVVFMEVQERLRREMPYDGPLETSDYYDYLKKLGTAVANSQEIRGLADTFMAEAIPRFAAQWQTMRRKTRP